MILNSLKRKQDQKYCQFSWTLNTAVLCVFNRRKFIYSETWFDLMVLHLFMEQRDIRFKLCLLYQKWKSSKKWMVFVFYLNLLYLFKSSLDIDIYFELKQFQMEIIKGKSNKGDKIWILEMFIHLQHCSGNQCCHWSFGRSSLLWLVKTKL